ILTSNQLWHYGGIIDLGYSPICGPIPSRVSNIGTMNRVDQAADFLDVYLAALSHTIDHRMGCRFLARCTD
ncbi:MAG TPA: hypothetical protein VFI05_11075, partial [Nitrospiraceae bacterium]|nr:hypothetical protein [Nitrospiraceae bacterium]